jgi:hypothetical protein
MKVESINFIFINNRATAGDTRKLKQCIDIIIYYSALSISLVGGGFIGSEFILNIIKFAVTLCEFNGAQIHEGKESQASGTWLWQRGIK